MYLGSPKGLRVLTRCSTRGHSLPICAQCATSHVGSPLLDQREVPSITINYTPSLTSSICAVKLRYYAKNAKTFCWGIISYFFSNLPCKSPNIDFFSNSYFFTGAILQFYSGLFPPKSFIIPRACQLDE